MRKSGSWQSIWDDRILEWIRDNDGSGTPKELKESGLIHVSQPHIGRRMKRLSEHGLLRHVGHGAYIITEAGVAYLEERYDAEEGVFLSDDAGGADSAPTDAGTGPESGT